MEESIYNLIPKEAEEKEQAPKYTSKFNQPMNEDEAREHERKHKDTYKDVHKDGHNTSNKRDTDTKHWSTMGPAKVPLRGPGNFLKGMEKSFKLPPEGGSFKYYEKRKPQVPKVSEKPLMGLRRNVDYIAENAIKNINSVAKVPKRNLVDSRRGNKQRLEVSGLEPNFVFKKEYGKTPEYLEKRKEEISRNEEYLREYMKERSREGEMSVMSEEDKDKIIRGLKENWDFAYKEYLSLPMVIDTPAKKHHKERLEGTMKQLEADVQLLEKHATIYVTDY